MNTDLPAGRPPGPGAGPSGSGVPVPPSAVRARPRRARLVGILLAVLVLAMFTGVGTALTGPTDSGVGVFHRSDQIAMIVLGLVMAAGIIAISTRPRVEADARGVRIRNIVGGYELPWQVVRAVRFDRGAPWATLDLQDDDVVSIMAVQRADKEYALATVRTLRALLAAAQAPRG